MAVAGGRTLLRKGSNYSAHVNDAHKASKTKMQDSIQRVERRRLRLGRVFQRVRVMLHLKRNLYQTGLKSVGKQVIILIRKIVLVTLIMR
nr:MULTISPECIES: hypothetical protein [Bacillus]